MRKARRKKRIHVKDAAAHFNVTPEAWRRWERGIAAPRFPEAVAEFLGITVDEVLGTTGGKA